MLKIDVISIHAPHTGCDVHCFFQSENKFRFQSTHPIRDATEIAAVDFVDSHCISIHAPHTGCDKNDKTQFVYIFISIHAPHTGCDSVNKNILRIPTNFNPRTPYGMRRALQQRIELQRQHFNPRTPYGMRRREYRARQ